MNLEDCVAAATARLPTDIQESFAADPMNALRDLGLTTKAVSTLTQTRHDGGACDGISFLEDGVILYAPTPTSRRQNFTLAHELGHWLVDQCDDVLDWLADQPNAAAQLETICDRVAARLLLPRRALSGALNGHELGAGHVRNLFDATNASWPVCAIALSGTLHQLGAVVLIDADSDTVVHSSVNPDPEQGWPQVFPWAGQQVPAGHPLKQLRDQARFTRRSFWRSPWGAEQTYYIDAQRDGRRIVAVFADTDVWGVERLHLDQPRTFDQRPTGEVRCCGETRQVRGYPCAECGSHFCPRCGKCTCERQAQREVLCAGTCYLTYLPHLLVGGLCEDCRA